MTILDFRSVQLGHHAPLPVLTALAVQCQLVTSAVQHSSKEWKREFAFHGNEIYLEIIQSSSTPKVTRMTYIHCLTLVSTAPDSEH